MKQADVLSDTEKRGYFRIDDVAVLQYRQVSEQDALSSNVITEKDPFSKLTMMSHFDSMTRELQTMSKVISKSSSNIANCLEMLDKKVNMIGEYLVSKEMANMEVEPQCVNIGAGGAAFSSPGAIITGAMLELRMILLPEFVGIFSYARVISCAVQESEPDESRCYKISIEFVNMEDDVRDLITRHVLHKERELMMEKSRGSD